MNEQQPVNKNPVKPGDAKRGAKPRDPSGQTRRKRTVYHTDGEQTAYLEWLSSLRAYRRDHVV